MSKEAIGENGVVLGSGDYWSRVNRSTFFGEGGLMRRTFEAVAVKKFAPGKKTLRCGKLTHLERGQVPSWIFHANGIY